MNEAWRWILASGLILAGELVGPTTGVEAGSPEISSVIMIHVDNVASVDHKTLLKSEQVATGIFRRAGVEIRWLDSPLSPENTPDTWRSIDSPDLQLRILPAAIADRTSLPRSVMGWAPGVGPDRRQVDVFYSRAKELAWRQVKAHCERNIDRPATVDQILGTIVAHELGHVLLNLASHTRTGIMRGDWDLNDLHDIAYGDLLFTAEQGELMRAAAERQAGKHHIAAVPGLQAPALAH